MKKNVKRFVSFIIISAILFSMVSISGISAQGKTAMADEANGKWVSAWSTSPIDVSLNGKILSKIGVPVYNATSRVSIEPAMSGALLRLVFSNEYGNRPLHIGACSVALSKASRRSIDTDTTAEVFFSGKTKTDIPAGEKIVSDPVALQVTAGEEISVSTYYEGLNIMRTVGLVGGKSYAALGNQVNKTTFSSFELVANVDSGSYEIIPALIEADVLSDDASAQTCVIFGDSTVSNEIPRCFAKILRDDGINNVSITQAAIRGNRLVADGVGIFGKLVGTSSLKRFEKDALGQTGVETVIVKIGINDVIHPYCKSKQDQLDPVPLEEMIDGYKALVEMAHSRGIKIYFCELTPWKGYTRNILHQGGDVAWSAEIDELRLGINKWFASNDNPADGFIPLPALTDESDPYTLTNGCTKDGIHYTADGVMTLAKSLPENIF